MTKEAAVRRKWMILGIVLLFLLSLTLGCAKKRAVQTVVVEKAVPSVKEMPAARAPQSGKGGVPQLEEGLTERMIIRTADLTIVVQNTDEALNALEALVKAHQGYVSEMNRWLQNEQPHARMTVRVPAEDLDVVLEAIHSLALRVEQESISGQDVTEEYIDLQARLENLQAAEKELRALLTEVRKNRGKAEDILAIYRELTEIRSQIETLQGRKQYLEKMTALATIHITIHPKEAPRALVEEPWNPLVTLSKALRAFVRLLRIVLDLLIYIVIFSPFVLVPILLLWLLVRWLRRKKKTAPPAQK
ncbi:MAG: DUF4349 domain-containing protein [Anaerolineae bacterium]|nr:DUF4349 domain-containing protein [Anaerolineae bacterium]